MKGGWGEGGGITPFNGLHCIRGDSTHLYVSGILMVEILQVLVYKKVRPVFEPSGPSGFRSMKRLGVFLLPPG